MRLDGLDFSHDVIDHVLEICIVDEIAKASLASPDFCVWSPLGSALWSRMPVVVGPGRGPEAIPRLLTPPLAQLLAHFADASACLDRLSIVCSTPRPISIDVLGRVPAPMQQVRWPGPSAWVRGPSLFSQERDA